MSYFFLNVSVDQVELQPHLSAVSHYATGQWPIPGNVNDFYTEVLNLSAGEWEYENSIQSLPKPNYNIGGDDYPYFENNCLKNADAYLITPLGCKKALEVVRKYGWIIPRVMFNSILFDVKYYRRKLFV